MDNIENQEFFRQVEAVIEADIKPFIEADGGRIELTKVEDNHVVYVQLSGACAGCIHSAMTLKGGVEQILRERVAEDIEVRLDL